MMAMRKLGLVLVIGVLTAGPAMAAQSGAASAGMAAAGPAGAMTPEAVPGPDAGEGGDESGGDTGNNLPPVASADLVKELYEVCYGVAEDQPDALGKAEARGWSEEPDNEGDGPFFTQTAASKEFGGIGAVELWGTVEYYPGMREGYCRVDFTDTDNIVNFSDFNAIAGLTGQVKAIGGDTYAAWQIGSDEPKVVLLAQRVGGDFQLEINTILPAAQPPMVTAPDKMPQPQPDTEDAPTGPTAD
jgi:hypothetical protein